MFKTDAMHCIGYWDTRTLCTERTTTAVTEAANKLATSKDLVKVAFEAALEKKATDIMALDMSDLLVVTDYFVLATGNTDIQVKAIATEIEKKLLEECKAKPAHREGLQEGKWVLLDYRDIVIHLFQPDFRDEPRNGQHRHPGQSNRN